MTEFQASASLSFDDVGGSQLKRKLEETVSPITIEARVEQAGGGSPAQRAVSGGGGRQSRLQRREHRWQRERNNILDDILEAVRDIDGGGGGGGLLSSPLAVGAAGVATGASVGGKVLGGVGQAARTASLGGAARAVGRSSPLGLLLGEGDVSDGIGDWTLGEPGLLDPTQEGGLDFRADEGPLFDVTNINTKEIFSRPDWLDRTYDNLIKEPAWIRASFENVLDGTPPWISEISQHFQRPDWLPELSDQLDRPDWIPDLSSGLSRPDWIPGLDDVFERPGWLEELFEWSPFGSLFEDEEPVESTPEAIEQTRFEPPALNRPTLPDGSAGGGTTVDSTIDVGDMIFDVDLDADDLRREVDDRVGEVYDEVDRVERELEDLRRAIGGG